MLGTVGQVSNINDGFLIPQRDSSGLTFKFPAGSKILCLTCQFDNEDTLVANGDIVKTTLGYDIKNEIEAHISKNSSSPLTILHYRQIVYVEKVISGSNVLFILPKGARVNNTLVETTGEFSVPTSSTYLIEY